MLLEYVARFDRLLLRLQHLHHVDVADHEADSSIRQHRHHPLQTSHPQSHSYHHSDHLLEHEQNAYDLLFCYFGFGGERLLPQTR